MTTSNLWRPALKPFAIATLGSTLLLPAVAAAAPGPGLGNLDCGEGEYFKPFAFIENNQGPNGTNVAVMIRGYFMTIFAPDSGHPPGEIGLYDVSNPKSPMEVRHIENGDTNVFREAHSLPWALIDGKHYLAIQTISGMQFWDFTDPLSASRIGSIDLPGVQGGDYENVAWQSTWQGRYLYVAGGNGGIYIVDAADPTNPQFLKQVPTSSTGGFRVGPLFAVGDYLVISNMDQNGAYAVLDISEPADPALLGQVRNLPRLYATIVGGNDRIYAAGRDGNFLTHSFTDPTKITEVKNAFIGQDQLYVAAQDHFIFLGRQNNFIKVDVTDEQNPNVVGEGDLGRDHPDHGQVTPLGNLIFIGNDHGTGSALFCHQRGQDLTPPTVASTYPKDGSVFMPTTSRVSVLLSDYVDTETIDGTTFAVRPAGGAPLPGIYTYNFNTISFGPDAELEPDTTYEVVLTAGGIHDVMGNALEDEVLIRFSTGAEIVEPPDNPDPSTGGAAGVGGSGGASTGGSGGAPSGTGATGGTPPGGVGGSGGSTPIGSGGTAPGAGGSPSSTGGMAPIATGGTEGNTNPPTASQDSGGGCALASGDAGVAGGLGSWLLALAFGLLGARRRTGRS